MVFSLLFVLALLFLVSPAGCEDVQGRVAFWKLDEGSGGTVVDSAEDHDGTLKNGPQWVVGRFGSALSFDGENNYVLMPFSGDFDFDNQDFSLVVWVKTENVYSQTQDTRIVNYGGSTFNQYMLLCQNDGRVCFYVDAGGGPANVYTNEPVDDGKWHLIVAVRDNTANRLKMYVDGEIQNTSIGGAGTLRNKEDSRRFVIGRRQKGGIGQTHSYFEGVMDELAIYNRALSDPEAQALYPTFSPLPGPFASGNWPLINYDSCNTRCTSSPGPTPRNGAVEKSWEWRAQDFLEEDSENGNVFSAIASISAPLIDDDKVFVFTNGLASTFFKDVIATVLIYKLESILGHSNPFPSPPSIDVHASKLYCINRHDGTLLWSRANPGRILSIAVDHDSVYVAIESDWTTWDDTYVGGVASLSKNDGKRKWENRDFEPQGSLTVQEDNVLVSLRPRGLGNKAQEPQLCCLDPTKNGAVKWAFDFSSPYGGPAYACGIAATATGEVLLSSTHGPFSSLAVLSCIQGSDSAARESWHKEFSHPISYPIVDGETVFVENGTALYGFAIKEEGKEIFRFEGDVGTPAIGNGKIVFITKPSLPLNNMRLYCLDRMEQEPPRDIEIPYSLLGGVSKPVIADETVIVSRRGGPQGTEILCFHLKDLTPKWNASMPWVGDLTQIAETPRVVGEQIFATYYGAPFFQDVCILCVE